MRTLPLPFVADLVRSLFHKSLSRDLIFPTLSQHLGLRMRYGWGPDQQREAYRDIAARLRLQTVVIDRTQLAAAGAGDELTLEDPVVFKRAYL